MTTDQAPPPAPPSSPLPADPTTMDLVTKVSNLQSMVEALSTGETAIGNMRIVGLLYTQFSNSGPSKSGTSWSTISGTSGTVTKLGDETRLLVVGFMACFAKANRDVDFRISVAGNALPQVWPFRFKGEHPDGEHEHFTFFAVSNANINDGDHSVAIQWRAGATNHTIATNSRDAAGWICVEIPASISAQ